ncbi:PAS domain-containing sensor histidine kinase [Gorillibacterium massiliense]|uniref:PAS domain-containing sensor histidine kinase n=1 Tax=Gorillibacterium massiliense TaxID=1280390 RepID=UPI001EE3677D|nr:PAS domain-containing sensor histidine kinase [Gorillibacterium massiliense]
MPSPLDHILTLQLDPLIGYINSCNQQSMLLVDEDGWTIAASPSLCLFLGYDIGFLNGQRADQVFVSGADFPSFGDEMLSIPLGHEVQLRCMIGEPVACRCMAFDIFSQGEARGRYQFYVFENLCHEMDLNLLQQFAGTFVKDVNLGVILIDTSFALVDISDTACRILGLERDRALGRPMDDVFSFLPAEHQLVNRSIFDGIVMRNHAVSWISGDDRFELLLDSSLLKDRNGETVGAYLLFKDVTNLRSLEEQVKRSDRLAMIGQIAAGTAHEIRNPLTSIKGFLQILRTTFIDKKMEKEQTFVEIMLTELSRINDLVSEFLLLSKRRDVKYIPMDIGAAVREILPIIHNEAILHRVVVNFEPCADLPQVIADKELLMQVFLNISKNGIEAMGDSGTLTITEKWDGEERCVLIEIHDTGPGIPHFLIDKIFDPFFTTKQDGTGLGLSVCQRIIHDMGGVIRVSSKGFGTTFTVSLPYP